MATLIMYLKVKEWTYGHTCSPLCYMCYETPFICKGRASVYRCCWEKHYVKQQLKFFTMGMWKVPVSERYYLLLSACLWLFEQYNYIKYNWRQTIWRQIINNLWVHSGTSLAWPSFLRRRSNVFILLKRVKKAWNGLKLSDLFLSS